MVLQILSSSPHRPGSLINYKLNGPLVVLYHEQSELRKRGHFVQVASWADD